MVRVLEPEVMESAEEARAYDELDRIWGDVLFQGFAESAMRMGVVEGRVIDVGCGPGRISVRLAMLNPKFEINGIDLSRNMLSVAEENATRAGVSSRTHFSHGDAKEIPFPDGTFDLAICHNFLHQLPEPIVALREINRVTKRSGAILVRDVWRLPKPALALLLPLYCIGYSPILRRLTYDSYYAGMSYSEFGEMAREAGIEGARLRRYTITHIGIERPASPFKILPPLQKKKAVSIREALFKPLYLTSLHPH